MCLIVAQGAHQVRLIIGAAIRQHRHRSRQLQGSGQMIALANPGNDGFSGYPGLLPAPLPRPDRSRRACCPRREEHLGTFPWRNKRCRQNAAPARARVAVRLAPAAPGGLAPAAPGACSGRPGGIDFSSTIGRFCTLAFPPHGSAAQILKERRLERHG